MRIKEAEQRTGLTAKALRLYESKGLLKPARETENDYRDYAEEDVARLKTIAILRKLDVPVKTIKEWTDGETDLRAILQAAAEENREASEESKLRHKLASQLAELVEEDPERDFGEAVRDIQEWDELMEELEELLDDEGKHIASPMWLTLIALGTILWTVIYIQDGMPGKALLPFVISMYFVIRLTLRWRTYLSTPKSQRKNDGCLTTVLLGVISFVAIFAIFIWIQNVQMDLFYKNQTDVMLYRTFPWLFLVEILGVLFWLLSKPWQRKWKWKRAAVIAAVLVALNLVYLQVNVMAVSVANEEGITRYSMLCPEGTHTPYSQIERIETGFKGTTVGLPIRGTGDFYYEITYADGRTEDWGEAICHEEEVTWSFLVWFDEWCRSGGAEKIGSDEFSEYCEMEQFYVDILIDVVNAR